MHSYEWWKKRLGWAPRRGHLDLWWLGQMNRWSKLHIQRAYQHTSKEILFVFRHLAYAQPCSCLRTWHSMIWFNSHFQNTRNIGQQTFSLISSSRAVQGQFKHLKDCPNYSNLARTTLGFTLHFFWHNIRKLRTSSKWNCNVWTIVKMHYDLLKFCARLAQGISLLSETCETNYSY
jgi:hypothetical protein